MLRAWMCVVFLAAVTASAQQWDVGMIGGYGVGNSITVKRDDGTSANTGFRDGAAFGVYGGEDTYRYWSGEVSYMYRQSTLKENTSAVSETFAAHSHIVTGALLAHFAPRESRVRPFLSAGGGVRLVVANGREGVPQPLCVTGNSCFAALTATHQLQAVAVVGGGVKFRLTKHLGMRAEVRDFVSGKPREVIVPGPKATLSGVPLDYIGTVSLGIIW